MTRDLYTHGGQLDVLVQPHGVVITNAALGISDYLEWDQIDHLIEVADDVRHPDPYTGIGWYECPRPCGYRFRRDADGSWMKESGSRMSWQTLRETQGDCANRLTLVEPDPVPDEVMTDEEWEQFRALLLDPRTIALMAEVSRASGQETSANQFGRLGDVRINRAYYEEFGRMQ